MSKRKVGLSAADISEKWNRNMKNAVTDIKKGIAAVTENPASAAVAQQDKMLTNLTAAVQGGKWAAGLGKVTLGDWKSKTAEKVGQRLPQGVDAAMTKRKEFDTYLKSTLDGVLSEIADMPSMTMSDSLARVQRLMEHMHNNPYKGT